MIPLDAISLAAAVIAFVDYGTKLTHKICEIHRSVDGAAEEHKELRRRTVELCHLCQPLALASQTNGMSCSSDEDLLVQLTTECTAIGESLETKLSNLIVKAKGPSRVFQSAKNAARGLLKADEFANLRSKMIEVQRHVDTCLLRIIRVELTSFKQQSEMEGQSLKDLNADQIRRLENLERELLAQQYESKQTQRALLRLGDELSKLVATTRSVAILESLRFKDMDSRYNVIEEAFQDTFEWIFEEANTSFKPWLQSSDGVFWVSGKAGSGKSTLMRYLATHDRTQAILQSWANGSTLVFATFYFWNTGSDLQKSQEGLLRSLLFQILRKDPERVRHAFPERWSHDEIALRFPEPWSRKELSKALDSMLSIGSDKKFCLLIDGLDEFHGQHFKLIDDLDVLAKYPNVKMCVSSRPWYEFQHKYGGDPRRCLKVEDLTNRDMSIFVDGELVKSERFRRLCDEDTRAELLVDAIVARSEGVFLWTFLTVRSLLNGIAKGDDCDMLQTRLEQTPGGLNELFSHTIDNIDEAYRPFTYRALLMVVQEASVLKDTIILWHLPDFVRDPSFALQATNNVRQLSVPEYRYACQESSRRLQTWCSDLLVGSKRDRLTHTGVELSFAHRTISTYVRSDEVQRRLRDGIGPSFDVSYALSNLYLCGAALTPLWLEDEAINVWADLLEHAIHLASIQVWSDEDALVSTLEQIVCLCERRRIRLEDPYSEGPGRSGRIYHGTLDHLFRLWPSETRQRYLPIINSLRNGDTVFAKHNVISKEYNAQVLGLSTSLAFAQRRTSVVNGLLLLGVDPNMSLTHPTTSFKTIWEWSLDMYLPQAGDFDEYIRNSHLTAYTRMWTLFLAHGADLTPFRSGTHLRERLEEASMKMHGVNAITFTEFLRAIDARIGQAEPIAAGRSRETRNA